MVKVCQVCRAVNDDSSYYCRVCNAYLKGPIVNEMEAPYPPLIPRPIPAISYCAYHPTIPALASCYVCRRPICVNCMKAHGGVILCLECAARAPYVIPVTGVLPPLYLQPLRFR
ncbi:MAG: hypothetical protein QXO32_01335 [Candidatus Bathyarchaeia archaeon]